MRCGEKTAKFQCVPSHVAPRRSGVPAVVFMKSLFFLIHPVVITVVAFNGNNRSNVLQIVGSLIKERDEHDSYHCSRAFGR